MLRDDAGHGDLEGRNLRGGQRVGGAEPPMLPVALQRRLPVHVRHARAKIQNPDLGNAGARVEGHLDFAIVLRRRVGYLNDQEHVPWAGMRTLVIVWTGLQQREVRLRLGVFTQVKRVLDIDNGLLTDRGREPSDQSSDTSGVPTPDRRHLDDLSGKQLDPVTVTEDAGFGHLMEFVHAEASLEDLRVHDGSLSHGSWLRA